LDGTHLSAHRREQQVPAEAGFSHSMYEITEVKKGQDYWRAIIIRGRGDWKAVGQHNWLSQAKQR
jgi:hypothetical protein